MNKFIVNYENVTYLPCVLDKNFKRKLEELLNSLDKNSNFILLFYTFSSSVSPLNRGDTLLSHGLYLCSMFFDSSSVFNSENYDNIKNIFLNKINEFNENSISTLNKYKEELIYSNEISFVKIFDISGFKDNIKICKNDYTEDSNNEDSEDDNLGWMEEDTYSISLNNNDWKFYNNSFYSRGLFEYRDTISYIKVLLCSGNGFKERNFDIKL